MIDLPYSASDEKYFADLYAVYMDPLIARVLSQARLYNDMLRAESVDDSAIFEIVKELDVQWAELLGEQAVVTGNVEFIDVNDETDDPRPVKEYYESQDVSFNGISARTLDSKDSFGTTLLEDGESQTSTYELRVQFIKEGINTKGDVVHMTGSAALEDIISLEFQQMMSPERARKWLAHFHPDVIDEIDVRLLNPSIEECEMVMRLKDISVDL